METSDKGTEEVTEIKGRLTLPILLGMQEIHGGNFKAKELGMDSTE